MDEHEMVTRIAVLEEKCDNMEEHMKSLDDMANELKKLSCSIVELTTQTKNTNEIIRETRDDVNRLKENPSKMYELIKTLVVSAIVSGVMSFFLSQVLQ